MNLIVFSLWGDNPKYLNGAVANAMLASQIYPGWQTVFFLDDLLGATAVKLRSLGALTLVCPLPRVGSYYWRHTTPDVFPMGWEHYIVRDCDSRLNPRERTAVDAWMASGKSFHFMRDHPSHTIPWMQGMYGVKGPMLRGMSSFFQVVPNEHSAANKVMTLYYREFIPKEDRLEHGEFNQVQFPDQVPFPEPRKDNRFVGEIFDSEGNPNDDWTQLKPK